MPDTFTATLVTGDARRIDLATRTGTVGHALDRLEPWIPTADGGWIQTRHIVELRPVASSDPPGERVFDELRAAAGTLARLDRDERGRPT